MNAVVGAEHSASFCNFQRKKPQKANQGDLQNHMCGQLRRLRIDKMSKCWRFYKDENKDEDEVNDENEEEDKEVKGDNEDGKYENEESEGEDEDHENEKDIQNKRIGLKLLTWTCFLSRCVQQAHL